MPGAGAPNKSASFFHLGPNQWNLFFSADAEFSALLTKIIEEAWGKRSLIVAGDFKARSTGWGFRETRQCATALHDAFATLEAVLLNTGDTPTFDGSLDYSVIDLTFASDTLAP
uniref:Endonuclease/exonuclease/phosphatase domain-containing protein n=1 Tax=Trichogramma kaykai TaxID=54128 RepID=A0ABD2WTB9_9HYME